MYDNDILYLETGMFKKVTENRVPSPVAASTAINAPVFFRMFKIKIPKRRNPPQGKRVKPSSPKKKLPPGGIDILQVQQSVGETEMDQERQKKEISNHPGTFNNFEKDKNQQHSQSNQLEKFGDYFVQLGMNNNDLEIPAKKKQ